jgi:predicted RNA-binding Zn ribbon-like protein
MKSSSDNFLALGHGHTGPWADLVNSEEWDTFGNPTEHLSNPGWLPYFLKQWHFAWPSNQPAPISKLKSLRKVVRRSCEAVAAGKTMQRAELHALNAAMNVTGKRQLFQRQNGLQIEFVPAAAGWDWIVAEIARSFADTLSSGEIARIKICRNNDCRWVFYDKTKGQTRCWCSDKSCGNRERVRRARAKNQGH